MILNNKALLLVISGLNKGFSSTPSGGFHQDIREHVLPKTVDELRNKRLSLTTEFDEDVLIASEKRLQLVPLKVPKGS